MPAGVILGCAQSIIGQVTVTCPVIGRAQPELTPSRTQKTGPEVSIVSGNGLVPAGVSSDCGRPVPAGVIGQKTGPEVNIGSSDGLVPSGNKPLPEPLLPLIEFTIWRHYVSRRE